MPREEHPHQNIKRKQSCLDLLFEFDFLPILKSPELFYLSNKDVYSYLYKTSFKSASMVEVAAVFLVLYKEPFLTGLFDIAFELRKNSKFFVDNHDNTIDLAYSYFSLDLYSLIAKYQPAILPRLLAFQKIIFTTDFFPTMTQIQIHLKHNLVPTNEENETTRELIMEYFLKFMLLSHPKNFDDQSHSFHTKYFFLLTACFYLVPLNLLPLYQELYLLSTQSHAEQLFLPLNHSFKNFNQEYFERRPIAKAFLTSLFSNPVLCAIAFKNNAINLLYFCDVEKCIISNPELFS